MGQITEIKIAKSKKARRHIYIDGVFVCTLDEFTVFKHKLSVGQEISLEKLEGISLESETDYAFEQAINLISKTPKTISQVRENLRGKGYLDKIIDAVITKLVAYKYLDDAQYAQMFVRTYCSKYGKTKLKYLLSTKGINSQIIEAALVDLEPQDDTIAALAHKYMQNKDFSAANFAKLYRFLSGKGFEWSEIDRVVGQMKKENYEDWD